MEPSTLTFPVAAHGAEAALRRAVAVLATDGYAMQSTSNTESIGIKRVIPPWAIVMSIIFGLFCLVGLLFLLVKVDREVKASFVDGPDGGSILVTGVMSRKVIDRLLAEFHAQVSAAPSQVPAAAEAYPLQATSGVVPPPIPTPLGARPTTPPPPAHEAVTIAPPPGLPVAAWASPHPLAESGVANSALIGGPDVPAIASPALDDADGHTIARPRRPNHQTTAPVVQFDDGEVLPVGDLMLIGRDPAAVPGEIADRLVPLTDESRGLSKTHAALVVDCGTLWVTDRHSTNGTAIRSASGYERACPPGRRLQVDIGDTVMFGGRSLERIS